jgi:hypothetical protein
MARDLGAAARTAGDGLSRPGTPAISAFGWESPS